ncbi:MAG: prolipoprotein diacylglyceryl transferase [Flavobacteriales bacterium]|nr:prolipoprotein diacylglyceryl transferase [Flavobacteriales bacterium]
MYPTISDLINDLFGLNIPLPIQSFGFFVALSFLFGAYVLQLEMKRKEGEGWLPLERVKVMIGEKASLLDFVTAALLGFVIGYKLLEAALNYMELVQDPQSFILSLRGNMLGGIAGAAFSTFLKKRESDKNKLDVPKEVNQVVHPYELIGNIVMIAAFAGLLGAKIFHNLENLDELMADPAGALTSFSGLTFYGGLICGSAAVLYYTKKHSLGVIHMLDSAGPGLMLAYGVGRIGCQVAGDGDWGIPNDAPKPDWLSFAPDWVWAYNYPNNVLGIDLKTSFLNDGYNSLTGYAWPTPLYEATVCIGLFWLLWAFRKKFTVPGMMFSVYLMLNGIERFFVEKIRVNTVYTLFGSEITQAEIISTLLFIAGVIGVIVFRRMNLKPKYTEQVAGS